jgi:hypothetical protein
MSDRSELDELSQRLLRSAAVDRPSEEARRRTALALGLAAPLPPPAAPTASGAATSASNASIPAAATANSAAAGAPVAAAAASGLPAVPWVAKVVLGLALTAGATAPLWPSSVPAPEPVAARAVVTEPSPLAPAISEPEPPAPALEAPTSPVSPVVPVAPNKGSAPRRAPRPTPALERLPEPATLAEETGLLERAHRALSAQDLPAMDEALAEYRRRCPEGRLAREAELLGLDRLWLAGDRPAFEAAARAFEERHPVPGLPPRLRAHLGARP